MARKDRELEMWVEGERTWLLLHSLQQLLLEEAWGWDKMQPGLPQQKATLPPGLARGCSPHFPLASQGPGSWKLSAQVHPLLLIHQKLLNFWPVFAFELFPPSLSQVAADKAATGFQLLGPVNPVAWHEMPGAEGTGLGEAAESVGTGWGK